MDVIIIGGGWAGIFTLKHCLEENLSCILIEKSSEYGGVWNVNNSPSVFPNTYSVTSKHYLSITDFPIPDNYPEFPHHSLVYKYMKSYVKHFNLYNYMSLDSKVERIVKNNGWNVSYVKDGVTHTIAGKQLAICTGQNSRCIQMPSIDYSRFKGTIIHANDYNETFRQQHCVHKKVLVYGGSDTSADIADELTNNMYSKDEKTTVILSFKKGRWIQRRNYGSNPADMFYSRSLNSFIKMTRKHTYLFYGNELPLEFWWGKGGSNVKEWQPEAGYLNSYYIKSSNIVNKVSLGEIIPKGNIETIHPNAVTFIDGTEEKIDTIIFATGYAGMNCMYEIPESIKNGEYYRHLFLVNDPSVVRVGFIRPYLTSIPMIIEMQSRYVAKVFSGKIQLPTQINMKLDYDAMKQKQSEEFSYDYERVQGIIDPYDYMDLIGYAIGAIPSVFSNLHLWKIIYFGSWSPFYYRLNDPDKSKREIAKQELIKLNHNTTSQNIASYILYIILNMIIKLIIFCIIIYLFKKYGIFKSMYKLTKKYIT
jgi:dimethylaniline monooxygenase (N-oxide forming)